LPRTRELVEAGIRRIARDIASAMGGTADVTYERGYPQTVNRRAPSPPVSPLTSSVATA